MATTCEARVVQTFNRGIQGFAKLNNFFRKIQAIFNHEIFTQLEEQSSNALDERWKENVQPSPPNNVHVSSFFQIPRGSYIHLHIQLSSSPRGKLSAPQLAGYHIAWLHHTYLDNPGHQKAEVQRLKRMIKAWTPNLNARDLRRSISTTQMMCLLKQLNKVFFAGMIPLNGSVHNAAFAWLTDGDKRLALCTSTGYAPVIHLHPWRVEQLMLEMYPWDRHVRMRDRLGSLAHELCHALFITHGDRFCPTWTTALGSGGHGRAWLALAAKLEEVVIHVLGLEVDLGIWESLAYDGYEQGKWVDDVQSLKDYFCGDAFCGIFDHRS